MLELSAVRCAPSPPVPHTQAVSIKVAAGTQLQLSCEDSETRSSWFRLMAGRSVPAAGHYLLNDQKVYEGTARKRAILRNQCIGLIDAQHPLLPHLNLQDNVALAARYRRRVSHSQCRAEARQILDALGLGKCCRQGIWRLDEDQQALAAFARALINRPCVLLVNDPRLVSPSLQDRARRVLDTPDFASTIIVSTLSKPLNWRAMGQELRLTTADKQVAQAHA